MATLKQIDANRRNALLSTGPRTDAGKQAASRNVLKSGIFAGSEIIPGEDPAALAHLTAEHHAHHHHATPEGRDLVDSLIRNAWLLRRLARAEAAIFNCDCQQCETRYADESDNAQTSLRYSYELKKFDLLQRRINSTERNYHRTLKALQTLPAAPLELICQNEPNFPGPIEAAPTESAAYQASAPPASDRMKPGAPAPILPLNPESQIPNPVLSVTLDFVPQNGFDLAAAARREMVAEGFHPDIPAAALDQLQDISGKPDAALRDLTSLLWSSIDNDDSRDLDQIEWAERVDSGIRVLIGIADVDSAVTKGTPIDQYAAFETTTVYASAHTFPMLPERLSTDLTSLNEHGERAALIIEFTVAPDGSLKDAGSIYRARVTNKAQLTYNATGAWLEQTAPAPPKIAASPDLQAQLKLQDQAAGLLREARHRLGALTFDRAEATAVMDNGHVTGIALRTSNRAAHLIEDFMIGANETMAQYLRAAGVSSIRRIVKSPERWARIVELAAQHGGNLPPEPNAGALNEFLMKRRQEDPAHYADVSLTVLKLMGPGEYVCYRPGDDATGHFGLAANDYTHSTAPNRRFADLVTQRLCKALAAKSGAPYTDDELDKIASDCTQKEDAARKVQRSMLKRIAAVAMAPRVGQVFDGIVTGVTPKGTFARVADPPMEGRVMHGEEGMDVGDRVKLRLTGTNPEHGFIDFARA